MLTLIKILAFTIVIVAIGGFLTFSGYLMAFVQKANVFTFCVGLVLMFVGVVLLVAAFAGLSNVRFIV